ncbi:type III pantothenate kinase [Candidatus Methylacidithermus pantelleriae]|uniref:Type III pantothenate kinase n=1 Tax=Candidatus Methylacidithermus pantelleriae TaxID=2744239 RepID=A0A8J2FR68_9BACT|nr:type III pantothenate kinase [Candidatus Methylacidithermus pantelleriae]CAF0688899.1 Type III pantothenate kinase [Candidatus Methylacidithermus pantelleriae]
MGFHAVDVGNRRVKWAWAEGSRLVLWQSHPTSRISGEWFQRQWSKQPTAPIVLCSVVPRVTKIFTQRSFHAKLVLVSSRTVQPLLPMAYPRPWEIGADRLANGIALREKKLYPAVAVDIGTAITFDVIDRKGVFCGGAIAPGPAVAAEFLATRTAQLPKIQIGNWREPHRVIGKSTKQALHTGLVMGWRGLVQGIVEAIAQELGEKTLRVVVTGGDAPAIFPRIPAGWEYDPLLTLEGIRYLGQYWLEKDKTMDPSPEGKRPRRCLVDPVRAGARRKRWSPKPERKESSG